MCRVVYYIPSFSSALRHSIMGLRYYWNIGGAFAEHHKPARMVYFLVNL